MKKKICVLLAAVLCMGLLAAGCSEKQREYNAGTRTALDEGEEAYVLNESDYSTYYNFIELYDGDGDVYDIGDPFVFRYDGKYYLYSSLNGDKRFTGKIPCWVSDNLVDWTWAGWAYGEGNAENPETTIACAPEVIYYQGWFYLCESETGNGHYFFRSKTPNGPFEQITSNLGHTIDGSFYLANDGQLYFMAARATGMGYMPVNIEERGEEVTLTLGDPIALPEATLSNMWTEGPGSFYRNGYNYLTFTGNHVDSAGYRIGYAYTQSEFLYDGLKTHENNVTLVSNGEDTDRIEIGYAGNLASSQVAFSNYRGTGHSSNVLGPNLDSIYTAYHNARRINYNNVQEGGERKYNLTRYYTNGGYVLSDSLCNFDVIKPALPDYGANADALTAADGKILTEKSTEAVYTAELNFRASLGRAELYASYRDENNYAKITIAGGSVSAVLVKDGKTTVLGGAAVELGSNAEALHTVRVASGANGCEVWVDNMRKIASPVALGGGRVGYAAGTDVSGTYFTNDAFGTSDFDAVKNLTGSFPAYTYVKDENRGWSIANAQVSADGVRQGESESTVKTDDGVAVRLEAGDWVKYNINSPEQGWYDLTASISAASRGAVFEVIIDNEYIYKMQADDFDFASAQYLETSCGRFFVDEGLHTMKIRVFDGTLEVKNFSTERYAGEMGEISESLTEKPDGVKTLIGYSYYSEEGMIVNEFLDRTMTYYGQRGMADYEFSTDVVLSTRTILDGDFAGGFLFRAKNYHYAENAKVSANLYGWQGYFLQISNTGLTLYKCNFNQKKLGTYDAADGETLFGEVGGGKVNIRVRAYHSEIEIYLNGELVMRCVDDVQPWTTGYIGFYGTGSEMICSNFTFREI